MLVEHLHAQASGQRPALGIDDAAGDEAAVGEHDRHAGLGLGLDHDRGDPGGSPALAGHHRVLARPDTRHPELAPRVRALGGRSVQAGRLRPAPPRPSPDDPRRPARSRRGWRPGRGRAPPPRPLARPSAPRRTPARERRAPPAPGRSRRGGSDPSRPSWSRCASPRPPSRRARAGSGSRRPGRRPRAGSRRPSRTTPVIAPPFSSRTASGPEATRRSGCVTRPRAWTVTFHGPGGSDSSFAFPSRTGERRADLLRREPPERTVGSLRPARAITKAPSTGLPAGSVTATSRLVTGGGAGFGAFRAGDAGPRLRRRGRLRLRLSLRRRGDGEQRDEDCDAGPQRMAVHESLRPRSLVGGLRASQ